MAGLLGTAGGCNHGRPGRRLRGRRLPVAGLGRTDQIKAFVAGIGRESGVDLLLCGSDMCAGGMVEIDWVSGGTQVRLTVPGAEEGNPCIGVPCRLVAHVWPEPTAGAAPPLAPAPVEIVVEA